MAKPSSGWRMPLASILILLGLVTLAMTLPAMAMLGWGALYMAPGGFGLIAAGIVLMLSMLSRRR